MGFARFADLDDAKINQSLWRKTTAATSVAGNWYDDSCLAGTPPANYYASVPLTSSTVGSQYGIRHWLNDGSFTEHLLESLVLGGSGTLEAPAQFMLCDYLLYYPFIDGNEAGEQLLDNTVTLPRFTDGVGLRMFIVSQGAVTGTGATYTISYTNDAGVSGRTATGVMGVTSSVTGEILTSAGATGATRFAPFVALQSGDRGVRSVESITLPSTPGGLMAVVIVKPLATFLYAEIGTPAEQTYFPRMPAIHEDARLGLLRCSQLATPNARTYTGLLTTIRS